MTDKPRTKVMGMLTLCDEGEILYDNYCHVLDDETVEAFGDVFIEAWRKWDEHRKACGVCGYK